jgi:hypothetical protein
MACGRSRMLDRGGESCGCTIRSALGAERAWVVRELFRGTGRGTFHGLNHLYLLLKHACIRRIAVPGDTASCEFRKTFRNSDGGSPGRDSSAMSGTVGEETFATELRWAG